jgi:drug/metabolite transporter (DMT)-like permease
MLSCAAVFNTVAAVGQLRGTIEFSRINVGVSLALAVGTVIGNIAMLRALSTLEPALASVVTHTQVFFVVVFAWVWLAEKPSSRFALGALVALGGFGLMRHHQRREVGAPQPDAHPQAPGAARGAQRQAA